MLSQKLWKKIKCQFFGIAYIQLIYRYPFQNICYVKIRNSLNEKYIYNILFIESTCKKCRVFCLQVTLNSLYKFFGGDAEKPCFMNIVSSFLMGIAIKMIMPFGNTKI